MENGKKIHDENDVFNFVEKENRGRRRNNKNKKHHHHRKESFSDSNSESSGHHPKDEEEDDDGFTSIMEMKQRKKKALLEFRSVVEDAILGNYILGKPNHKSNNDHLSLTETTDILLWDVPLLPSKGHEGTDIVLSKFLRARHYNVHEAFEMLRKTLKWRKENNMDSILEEDDSDLDLGKTMYLNGTCDKEGHPLYYNVYGVFKDHRFYKKILGTGSDRDRFIRKNVQCIEKGIKQLSFKPGGVNSIVQITDLKNSPGPGMKELRSVNKKCLVLNQENYPDLIHRHIFINVPLWFYVCHVMSSKFISQRTKSKFVFARPSEATKTLLKYVGTENLPVAYDGLFRENDEEFFPEDKALDILVRKNSTECINIPVSEIGVTMIWDFNVVGWDVSYKVEFIPEDEGSYKVLLQHEREKKGGGSSSVRNSFYINEPGIIIISIINSTMKKKSVFYRFKANPTPPLYSSLFNK